MKFIIKPISVLVLVVLILVNGLVVGSANSVSLGIFSFLMAGATGTLVEYNWGRVVEVSEVPTNTMEEIVNRLYLLEDNLINTVDSVLYLVNIYLPRAIEYYVKLSGARASAECVDKVKNFEDSEVGKVIKQEIHSLYNNITAQIIKTFASYFSLYYMYGYRAWLLQNKENTVLCYGYTCVIIYSNGDTYIYTYRGSAPGYIRVGSLCKFMVKIEYTDFSIEDIVVSRFIMGYPNYEVYSESYDVIFDLSEGVRNGKTIYDFWVEGVCEVEDSSYEFTWIGYPYTDFYEDFLAWLGELYSEAKNVYDFCCYLTNTYGGEQIDPPSIVLPFKIDDLEKIPLELRLQFYISYLENILVADWRTTVSLTPDNVTIIYPNIIISQGREYRLLLSPYSFKMVRGNPVPLAGIWYMDGKILLYPVYGVEEGSGHVYELVGGDLYWVKDYYYGLVLGVAIDVDKDGIPDVWTPNYVIVEELYVWDPETQTWKSSNFLDIEPEPVNNWIIKTGIDRYLENIESGHNEENKNNTSNEYVGESESERGEEFKNNTTNEYVEEDESGYNEEFKNNITNEYVEETESEHGEEFKNNMNQSMNWFNKLIDLFKNIRTNFDKHKHVIIGAGVILILLIIITLSRRGGRTVVVRR